MLGTLHEYVIDAMLFREPPVAGQFFVSQSGGTTFHVEKVRRVGGDTKLSYRLIGTRLPRGDIPPEAVILPWPRKPVGRPRAAAMGPPPAPPPIVTRATKAAQERKRVLTHNRMLRDPTHLVEPVRVASGSAIAGDWRDPEDTNPNRRTVRVIHGFKSLDRIEGLLNNGNINKAQARAARGFRRLYETGEIGLGLGTRDLTAPPCGFGSGLLPSESRSQALAQYQAVCQAIGRHLLEVLLVVIIQGYSIQNYAERRRMGRSAASGYMLAALDAISDHFKRLEDEAQPKSEVSART